MTFRLGVDVGGTFTDLLLVDEASGHTYMAKVLSTPEDSSVGVLNGIERICDESEYRYKTGQPGHAWDDRCDQRRTDAQRRQGWADHDEGLSASAAGRALVLPGRTGRLGQLYEGTIDGATGANDRSG